MLRTRLAVQLLRLGAEIKGDDRRVDQHEVLAKLTHYGLPRKDRRQRQRHDRFDRQQIFNALQNLFHTSRSSFLKLCRDFQSGSLDWLEVYYIVFVLFYPIFITRFYFFPAVSRLVIQCPALRYTEITVVMIKIQPVNFHSRYGVMFV